MDTINVYDLLERLEELFPGVQVERSESIGGEVLEVVIWEFTLSIKLTTSKVAHADVPGSAVLSFWQSPGARRLRCNRVELKTTSKTEALQFLADRRAYLEGILFVLTDAFDPDNAPGAPIPEGVEGLIED